MNRFMLDSSSPKDKSESTIVQAVFTQPRPTAPFEHGRSRMMPIGDLERNADIGGVYGRS
jgi:hypothetical protein